jgi:hypothetical protein
MISISNVDGLTATRNEALRGIRRSRFSLHLNTAHRRRWLLVQLVTAPALEGGADDAPAIAQPPPAPKHDLDTLYRQFDLDRLRVSAR